MLRIGKYILLFLILFLIFNQSTHIQADIASEPADSNEEPIEAEEPSEADQENEQSEELSNEENENPVLEQEEITNSTEPHEFVEEPIPEVIEEELPEESEVLEELEQESNMDDDAAIPKEDGGELTTLNAEPLAGLVDIALLTDTELKASHVKTRDGKEKITLAYKGYGVLNLSLLESTYAIFQLPPEIARRISIENIRASYDVPALGLLGAEIRNPGDFAPKDISISGNQVVLNFKQFLSLSFLNRSHFDFTLEIDLDELPETEDGLYTFRAEATSQIVDLSVLSGNVATATLGAPQVERVLGFYSIPRTLPFQTTVIDSKPVTIGRQDPNWGIEVKDTRGANSSWKITAEAMRPLTSTVNSSHSLPDALVYVDEHYNKYSLSRGAVEVFRGGAGADPITTIRWTPDTGPLIQVVPTDAYAETYSTTITWTLLDAP